MATLSIGGENKLGWIGTEFMEGKAKIVTIAPRHIIIQEGVALTVIKLWTDKAKGAKGKGASSTRGRGKGASQEKKPGGGRGRGSKSADPDKKPAARK